jgi:hypothetical protein
MADNDEAAAQRSKHTKAALQFFSLEAVDFGQLKEEV